MPGPCPEPTSDVYWISASPSQLLACAHAYHERTAHGDTNLLCLRAVEDSVDVPTHHPCETFVLLLSLLQKVKKQNIQVLIAPLPQREVHGAKLSW